VGSHRTVGFPADTCASIILNSHTNVMVLICMVKSVVFWFVGLSPLDLRLERKTIMSSLIVRDMPFS
jgi:hypothetical protein